MRMPINPPLSPAVLTNGMRDLGFIANPNYVKFRAAMGRVRSGTGPAFVNLVGDSTTAGFGSTGASMGSNARSKSSAVYAAALLTAMGLNASNDAAFGSNGAGTTTTLINGYDNRVTFSGAASFISHAGFGGGLYGLTTGAGSVNFNPGTTFDRIEVIYIQTGTGVFGVGINGGANITTQSVAGTNSIQRITVNCTLGANTVNLNWVSGTSQIYGVSVWNSAAPSLVFRNGSVSGTGTTYWTSGGAAPWDSAVILGNMPSTDLTIINLNLLDAIPATGVSVSTFDTRLRQIATNAALAGDVVLMCGVPDQRTDGLTLEPYEQVVRNLAYERDLALIDMRRYFRSYTLGNSLGLYSDFVHLSATGYAAQGEAYVRTLLNM